ncbi:thioredoxin domain-containing protein [Candidatus Daviesbacteria bacterium]|nr:thioredoxin domain-containing protein [Candidatus Daviesbacteria bacterium]MBI3109417.1 thioredoxin domain-containing protein [Candidatus Daviesbacteria bacterium]
MKNLNPLNSTPVAILAGALIVAVAVLTSGGIIKFGQPVKTTPVTTGTTQPAAAPEAVGEVEGLRENDHVRGDRNAKILLIEYSDLECPFCKRFHPTAQQAVDDYQGQVAWVYRHFPLDQIHSKADKEAEATECANELGGNDSFWKMTDKIFEATPSNNGLDLATLPDLAAQVGLDKNKFKACLDSGKYAGHVEEDYQSGLKAGVRGTPGSFLLDQKSGKKLEVPGAVPFDSLKSSIDSLLK